MQGSDEAAFSGEEEVDVFLVFMMEIDIILFPVGEVMSTLALGLSRRTPLSSDLRGD